MIEKTTIPAGHGKAFILNKSQTISVINTYGTQVVDCWAFNKANTNEYMSMEASRVWSQRLNPILGDTFVTNNRNKILTIVEDTSPGIHDTFMAACDEKRYKLLGVKKYHRNCCDNLVEALKEYEINYNKPILASFNIFMNIEVQEDKKTLKTLPTGNFFSNFSNGFSCASLCEIATLLFVLSISVITHSISSPTLNIFFAETFFLFQLNSLE